MKKYGKELILDLHDCNSDKFNRKDLDRFFKVLCDLIDMQKCKRTFWDYQNDSKEEYDEAPDHLKGTSAVQFISTSNITIHTLDVSKTVYLNIFSCKDFDEKVAITFCKEWFAGIIVNSQIIDRV